ncbi:MAG: hypothetical protein MMC33_010598 [Icmadophila ericetorum]|nr:hypothetical protein [Icmadophila ericetorum]
MPPNVLTRLFYSIGFCGSVLAVPSTTENTKLPFIPLRSDTAAEIARIRSRATKEWEQRQKLTPRSSTSAVRSRCNHESGRGQTAIRTSEAKSAPWVDHVKDLISAASGLFQASRVSAQLLSSLCSLPAEILVLIQQNLPLSSQAAFVLTCKKINLSVGNRSWLVLLDAAAVDERRALLFWLSKDDPFVFSCYSCARLHTLEVTLQHYGCRHHAEDKSFFPHQDHTHYSLRFRQIKLAIRAHTVGPNFGLPLHGLSLDQLGPRRLEGAQQRRTRHGKSKIRRQIREQSPVKLLMAGYRSQLSQFLRKISCEHQVNHALPAIRILMQMEKLQRESPAASGYIGSCIYRCTYCATELQYMAEPLFSRGLVCRLSVTAWKDLGIGFNPTAQPWQGHQYLDFGVELYHPATEHEQSIWEAFETEIRTHDYLSHLAIEPLTARLYRRNTHCFIDDWT